MAENIFEKIQNRRAISGIPERGRAAQDWFQQLIRTLFGTRLIRGRDEIIGADGARLVPRPSSRYRFGRVFMFVYNPKAKNDLPYYDKFPLLLTLGIQGNHLLGLNLHYLPMIARASLFNTLTTLVSDNRYDDQTRILVSYKILTKMSKLSPALSLVKEYDMKNILSPMLEVHPKDWEIALFLPTEAFEKQGRRAIWDDTQTRINDRNKNLAEANRIKVRKERQAREAAFDLKKKEAKKL